LKREALSGLILTLLLLGLLSLAFNIQRVRANGTIYIRPDGNIDPPTAPIRRDGDVYTLTGDIAGSIVVERNNTVMDGDGHTLSAEIGDAFTLASVNNVTIQNTRTHSYYGFCIRVSNSSSCTICGNDLQQYASAQEGIGGIYLSNSPHTTIYGNEIRMLSACVTAIHLDSSSLTNVSENTIWVSVGIGIDISSSSFTNLFKNNIAGLCDCVILHSSSFNNISENYLDGAGEGGGSPILAEVSSNNTIVGNTCIGKFGMEFTSSNNNTIQRNRISNGQGGVFLDGSNNNICENDIQGWDGLGVGGSNNNVYKNNITNCEYGGLWVGGSNNNIYQNNIANNINPEGDYCPGLGVYGSNNNIYENNIENNDYGIIVGTQASNNIIYHNNFVDNTYQVFLEGYELNSWDDGYPSGGNYWSDYIGADANRDGIGDTPYIIDANNRDRYPLVNPWNPIYMYDCFESGSFSRWSGKTVTAGETANIVNTRFHHGAYSAKFTSNGGGGYERAYCYKNIASSAEVYARGYFYVSQSGIAHENDRLYFIIFKAGNNNLAYAGWRKIGGIVKWNLLIRQGSSYQSAYSSSSPSLYRWYCVELQWKKDATRGLGELWVNGVRVCSITGKNTAVYGDANTMHFGLGELYGCTSTIVYGDCSATSNTYIGPEVIVRDGFESGGFAKWSGTSKSSGETATVVDNLAYNGIHSAKFTSNGGGGTEWAACYKTISSSTDLYARGYFRVETSGIAHEGDRLCFIKYMVGSNSVAYAGWRRTGGVVKWCLMIRSGTSWVTAHSTSGPSLNRWYNVELHWTKSSTSGKGELWINGVRVCYISGRNTAYYGSANRVDFGLPNVLNCAAATVYCDNCAISNMRIGTG